MSAKLDVMSTMRPSCDATPSRTFSTPAREQPGPRTAYRRLRLDFRDEESESSESESSPSPRRWMPTVSISSSRMMHLGGRFANWFSSSPSSVTLGMWQR